MILENGHLEDQAGAMVLYEYWDWF